jgi:cytochrome c
MDRIGLTVIAIALLATPAASADGNAARGSRFFQQGCAACHSLEPDRNVTGPSLAGVVVGKLAHSQASAETQRQEECKS